MYPQIWSQVPWSQNTQMGWTPQPYLLLTSKASTEASKTAHARPRRGAGQQKEPAATLATGAEQASQRIRQLKGLEATHTIQSGPQTRSQR